MHDESMTSINWLVKNVTYRDNCYMCVDSTYKIKFHFFNATPSDPGTEFTQVMGRSLEQKKNFPRQEPSWNF